MRETKKYLLVAVMAAFLAILLPSLSTPGQVGGAYVDTDQQLILAPDKAILIPKRAETVADPELSARAVVVKDINSDLLLFEKNRRAVLPIASLTKLLTAVMVRDRTELDEVVEILEEDVDVVPFTTGLRPGELVLVEDLLRAMLIASANDAALALARISEEDGGFVSEMNRFAKKWEMDSSSFMNPVGFDDPNHYSTATDLIVLVDKFLEDPTLREIVSNTETVIRVKKSGREMILRSTNKLLGSDERIKGIKTGFTTAARGSMVVLVEDPEHPYYVIVLGSQNREQEVEMIIEWVERAYEWK